MRNKPIRKRPIVEYTLDPTVISIIDLISNSTGLNKSRTIEEMVYTLSTKIGIDQVIEDILQRLKK